MPRFAEAGFSRPSDAPRVKDRRTRVRTVDPAAQAMLARAEELQIETAFDRFQAQQPQCQFGYQGICCRLCIQGPCRIRSGAGPSSKGICGAPAETIVARNLARMMAAGAACHSDHGRHIADAVLEVADHRAPAYRISDPEKLRRVAERLKLEVENKSDDELARAVAEKALVEYGRLDKEANAWISTTVTRERLKKLDQCNILPGGIYGTISELLAQTHIGMDADPVNIVFGGLRSSLVDYAGMHIATDLSDVLFGTPRPTSSEANLGVLDKERVNIALHGHNPLLSEMIVRAARDLEGEAWQSGAKGINIVGICCTGNEILMRQGVPLATNFASQELVLVTGAVEAMVVDVQCIMPGLRAVAECFHTKLVTTNPLAKIPGSYHFDFQTEKAEDTARQIVRLAIAAYQERDQQKVDIPEVKSKVVAGFSLESLLEIFSHSNETRPIRVLLDAILEGHLRGLAVFIGCNNLKGFQDENFLTIAQELAVQDVFMVSTGCASGCFAKHGLMSAEGVEKYAGPGLKSFLQDLQQAAGLAEPLPLILHMGSCVDNSRVADLTTLMAEELGVDVPKVPVVVSGAEAMSEKAVAIASWYVALGHPVHVGPLPPIEGSPLVYSIATQIAHDVYGGYFIFEPDPQSAARKMLQSLDYRTWKLRVHQTVAERFEEELCLAY